MMARRKPAKKSTRYTKARRAALAWYRRNARVLPWRAVKGEVVDPYRVWLSEVMLQQTTVAVVEKRFADFIRRWPDVHALARARRDSVMAAWAGLGYYARARNLHECARVVAREHGGVFPSDEKTLMRLPGIGGYTAAAIAGFAFGRRAVVVDANVKRVVARWDEIDEPLASAEGERAIFETMDALTPSRSAGDFAQSLMDISAAICRPRNPDCGNCPLAPTCRGKSSPEKFPVRRAKPPRPVRHGVVLVARDGRGNVLMARRPERGMLGGMMVFPGSNWADGSSGKENYEVEDNAVALELLKLATKQVAINETVEHVFTHFRVSLTVIKLTLRPEDINKSGLLVVDDKRLGGLPTVMKKAARAAGLTI